MRAKSKYMPYVLEIIVFISGAVVMILELVGSRVLSPYVGTSIFVWTSLIGVILGSLSLGYWWGGRIADKKANDKIFSILLLVGALSIALLSLIKTPVLSFIQYAIPDIRLGSIIASIILFTLPSALLGSLSPYAVRLKMKTLASSGKTVGNLSAISTMGSIVGTFLAGFFLIAYFGNTKILIILSLALAGMSLLAYRETLVKVRLILIVFLLLAFSFFSSLEKLSEAQGFIDIDTPYQRAWIFNTKDPKTMRPIRALLTDGRWYQSAMFSDRDDDLVFDYTKFYRLAWHFNPLIHNALMIGGGAYSYPKDYLKKHPDAALDVAEIDPYLTELSKRYFNLTDDPRLTIYHEDGRTFLNRQGNRYDALFIDAFKPFGSMPYQLTTQEAVKKMYEALSEKGVILTNVISSIEGDKGKFLRAEYLTYSSVFPRVYLFPVSFPRNPSRVQNVMLVALKQKTEPAFASSDSELNSYLAHLWKKPIESDTPLLTDERAPVDYYTLDIR